MPELPEVETVCQGLNHTTLNQEIRGGDVLLPRTIAYPFSIEDFLAGLQGTTLFRWHRRGKYLLGELHTSESQAAGWLGVHLRMTGQLRCLSSSEALQKHTRVRLFLSGDQELRFVDQRTFGQIWWVPPDRSVEQVISGLQQLGPEPFSESFSSEYLRQQLLHRRRPIKNALLDQTIVAGLGNIYADEALFLSRIHPECHCTQLKQKQIERLRGAILEVLQSSLDVGGTTFSTFQNVQGINGNYGKAAWVYGRGGEACRVCGTLIQRLRMAGRSAHFCPQCQQ
ncbi:DNA-formamidopyrimidine glycosylase [Leptolyngbya sp. 'hensonii']|uniref:DNA-formamidopyrimidine glycosylase n=1 Tax=Leptolyngbya sp. 'hensonii' TaxID=1922337 RepID=UPI00094F977F|nr:DNA-formamidopyrimidine glycosylase [Leptolyngbya sp. 'hensonii']OLP19406.1 DNA-formamidopyrimidine glycosylase [Leptolyngbya sp. 'hensonii']